jgi:hypothetical protein
VCAGLPRTASCSVPVEETVARITRPTNIPKAARIPGPTVRRASRSWPLRLGAASADHHIGDESGGQPQQDSRIQKILPSCLLSNAEQLDDDIEDRAGGQGQEDDADHVGGELAPNRGA